MEFMALCMYQDCRTDKDYRCKNWYEQFEELYRQWRAKQLSPDLINIVYQTKAYRRH